MTTIFCKSSKRKQQIGLSAVLCLMLSIVLVAMGMFGVQALAARGGGGRGGGGGARGGGGFSGGGARPSGGARPATRPAGGYGGNYTPVNTSRTNINNGNINRPGSYPPNYAHIDTGSNIYVNTHDYHPGAAFVAGAVTGAAVAASVPPGCSTSGGYCNGYYYEPVYQGTQIVYQVVPAQ